MAENYRTLGGIICNQINTMIQLYGIFEHAFSTYCYISIFGLKRKSHIEMQSFSLF